MNDPLDPLAEGDPFDDPLLNGLERSIEKPPGLRDPLADPDELLMDDLGRQLDALEASIENSPPVPPLPGTDPDTDGSIPGGSGPAGPEPSLPEEASSVPESTTETFGSFDTSPPPPQDSHHRLPPPNPPGLPSPRRGGGGGRRTGAFSSRHRIPGHLKPKMPRPSYSARYCPETHEMIDKKQCESCEKYRHWPEGTTEEPRQCWHDWQATQPNDRDKGLEEED